MCRFFLYTKPPTTMSLHPHSQSRLLHATVLPLFQQLLPVLGISQLRSLLLHCFYLPVGSQLALRGGQADRCSDPPSWVERFSHCTATHTNISSHQIHQHPSPGWLQPDGDTSLYQLKHISITVSAFFGPEEITLAAQTSTWRQ